MRLLRGILPMMPWPLSPSLVFLLGLNQIQLLGVLNKLPLIKLVLACMLLSPLMRVLIQPPLFLLPPMTSMQGSKLALLLELGKHIYGSRSLSGTGGTGIDFTTVGSKARSAFGSVTLVYSVLVLKYGISFVTSTFAVGAAFLFPMRVSTV